MTVTVQEIVEKLKACAREIPPHKRPAFLAEELANRIEREGIAPPDRWVLVPIEPTAKMFASTWVWNYNGFNNKNDIYKAMIAAAPKPEVKP